MHERNWLNQVVPHSRARMNRPDEYPGYWSGSEWNEMHGPFGRKAQGANTPLGPDFANAGTTQGFTKEGFIEPDYFVPQSHNDNTSGETWMST